ncbi:MULTISPECIES: HD-GYP domain-containing protein [unclassified Undibacterium]|uniref:HD-GYP domain-containing protein n=1 Tax=unclassified Undibacterium TaxID=2630295 RepID=UPI002AC9EAF7|nr:MULTISPECIES: HD domain-containing phosphohydrolase [unclassified Undibacterium]MEB0137780.1 DUF3391 domain-containing protein [Undibacterium sp. CCC2.1]MEB0171029.1 DUF3391 domain-containing protein [Undibacterium sp. CCC1.1]MEB0175074.1 DUF3391 domain-containing protein [Undibacterium sp. CCC3.4]MEB0215148.1 DUF3391 domain-containing protein [Undibacterium sp. 5I2]WPX44878.1 DUF3391 domain-containing protein [Undibacterium sp. CCC3.4]
MTDISTLFIEPAELKIGMFIYLDISWLEHPFPSSNFKISNAEQIATIRSLGLTRLRYAPAKSSVTVEPAMVSLPAVVPKAANPPSAVQLAAQQRRTLLAEQAASLQVCERQFSHAASGFRQVSDQVHAQPEHAKQAAEQLIQGFLAQLLNEDEAAIRVLSEKGGEKNSLHAINVTVISLLLGKTLGLSKSEMFDLGIGAMLHDIGKIDLPDRLRWFDEHFSSAEKQLYRTHVVQGVNLARKMQLPPNVVLLIAQHHEHVDASGYPAGVSGEKMVPLSRIVSLVNHYDNLCNPTNPALAVTPHEALAQIFAQHKTRFDLPMLTAFIRMMGVYPPGSLVQLTDERYAMVMSVNATRPLKPVVIVHDPAVPREDALLMYLEREPQLGIRRSLKPLQLPRAAYDYLSPRKRLCYFFERGVDAGSLTLLEGGV